MLKRRKKSKKSLLLLQVAALFFSIFLVFVFLRFFVVSYAKKAAEDFERQTFIELSRGDGFSLARKLSAMSKGSQFTCILAKKNGEVFFQSQNGSCYHSLFRATSEILEPNHSIEIQFTAELENKLFYGFLLFLSIQAILAATLFFSQRAMAFHELQHEVEIAGLMKHVIHDIRSPLAALRVLSRGEKNPLLQRALLRLQEMIGYFAGAENKNNKYIKMERLWLEIAEEKKIEYDQKKSLFFRFQWNGLEGIWLMGDPFLWRRALSNIINNAIEATTEHCVNFEITFSEVHARKIKMEITDFGKGISKDIIYKVGKKDFSFGKNDGMGIGLFSIKKFLEKIQGQLSIDSQEGKWTKVTIEAPRASAKAILIEDDLLLTKAWSLAACKAGIDLRTFSCPEDFQKEKGSFSKDWDIFMDLNFPRSRVDALGLVRHLLREGYALTITTGQVGLDLRDTDCAVRGKEPPWLL